MGSAVMELLTIATCIISCFYIGVVVGAYITHKASRRIVELERVKNLQALIREGTKQYNRGHDRGRISREKLIDMLKANITLLEDTKLPHCPDCGDKLAWEPKDGMTYLRCRRCDKTKGVRPSIWNPPV